MMGRNLGKPFSPVLKRLLDSLGVSELVQLSETLGAPYGTVRNWHQRDKVPVEWLQAAATRTGRTVDWYLAGDQDGAKKFAPSGLQINQKRRGGAFAKEQPASQITFDPVVMEQVITAVLTKLDEQDLRLDPAKAAELIMLIYEDIADGEHDTIEEGHVTKKASRLLRLVG